MSVTIAIPVYNAEKYLFLAMSSVLNQSFTDFELIILDDGSSDKSMEIARSFNDDRIRIISDGKNLGLPARLNQITKLAKFDLIARMDADDIIPLDRIEKQYEYLMSYPQKDLVTMGCAYIDDAHVLGVSIPKQSYNLTFKDMLNGQHGICHASILVRKSWYKRNQYDSEMHRVEDYELWLRAFLKNDLNVGHIQDIGYYYRSDVTLNVDKYVNTFNGGLLVANKHNLSMEYKIKMKFKIILSKLIFACHLQDKILSKLSYDSKYEKESIEYNYLLNKLNS